MAYEDECLNTLSYNFSVSHENEIGMGDKYDRVTKHILHGAIGIATEAAEILDAVKKSIFYGKPFDLVNLQEEIGDCFWYLAILAKECGVSFQEIQAKNIAKLKARYPDKFTEENALNRDLEGERRVLES